MGMVGAMGGSDVDLKKVGCLAFSMEVSIFRLC